jgi:hypothetical protein
VQLRSAPFRISKHPSIIECICAVRRAGLDYTRAAFGPCTAPGVPAATCIVVYMEDLAPEDNQLDESREGAHDQWHGTNVAGIIASEYGHWPTAWCVETTCSGSCRGTKELRRSGVCL